MVIHVIDNLWVTDRLFLSENGFLKLSCGHLLGRGDVGWQEVSVKVLVGGVDHTLVCVFDALLSFAYTSCGNYLDMVTCLDRGISDLVKQWSKCCWEGNFLIWLTFESSYLGKEDYPPWCGWISDNQLTDFWEKAEVCWSWSHSQDGDMEITPLSPDAALMNWWCSRWRHNLLLCPQSPGFPYTL